MTKAKNTASATPLAMLLHIPLAQLVPSHANPRMTLDKAAFLELKKSIQQNGLLQPIAVRVAGDKYEIVGGHRRYHAVCQLAHEHPDDPRFATMAALVVDMSDSRVAAARLAENLNRDGLNPLEIAEGVADALKNGMSEEELAESLGWKARNVYRYRQFHEAPTWLKGFATEVPLASKKLDERGAPVLNAVTDAPEHEIEKLPGLAFTHLFELLTFYNLLRERDAFELQEKGGEHFRPTAERIIKKLARSAAKEQWAIAKLRAEIKKVRDPAPKTPSSKTTPAFVISDERAAIDFPRIARSERADFAAQLTNALLAMGYESVVIIDKSA